MAGPSRERDLLEKALLLQNADLFYRAWKALTTALCSEALPAPIIKLYPSSTLHYKQPYYLTLSRHSQPLWRVLHWPP